MHFAARFVFCARLQSCRVSLIHFHLSLTTRPLFSFFFWECVISSGKGTAWEIERTREPGVMMWEKKKNTGGGGIKRGMSGKTEYMSNTPHRSLEMDGRLEIDQEIARKKINRQQKRERERNRRKTPGMEVMESPAGSGGWQTEMIDHCSGRGGRYSNHTLVSHPWSHLSPHTGTFGL